MRRNPVVCSGRFGGAPPQIRRRSRLGAAVAAGRRWPWRRSLAACGGDRPRTANEPSGTYEVKVTERRVPRPSSSLGQTSLLQLGVRNDGDKTSRR